MGELNQAVRLTDAWSEQDQGLFSKGARSKRRYISPADVGSLYPGLKPTWSYLFKESFDRYPWQFWIEIVADRLSRIFGAVVPPAHLCVRDEPDGSSTYAALIEWFYDKESEVYIEGGNLLTRLIEGFDREEGTQHNLATILGSGHGSNVVNLLSLWVVELDGVIRTALENQGAVNFKLESSVFNSQKFKQDWTRIMAFDSLIGNRDRHQDNWGVVFSFSRMSLGDHLAGQEPNMVAECKVSPAFDNGTSLGHEIIEKKIDDFTGSKLLGYLTKKDKARHHMHWDYPPTKGPMNFYDFLALFCETFPGTQDVVAPMLNFTGDDILSALEPLVKMSDSEIDLPTAARLTRKRIDFIAKLVVARRDLIRKALAL